MLALGSWRTDVPSKFHWYAKIHVKGKLLHCFWHSDDRASWYRVIHKSLRNFRPLRYSSRDGHAEGEHVNRGRDTPNFCPTLQVLDMSTLGDAAHVNPVIKSPRVDISSTCKVGQKIGVSLSLLTCSPSTWPSRLLYRSGRKSRRDLWITLYYIAIFVFHLPTFSLLINNY